MWQRVRSCIKIKIQRRGFVQGEGIRSEMLQHTREHQSSRLYEGLVTCSIVVFSYVIKERVLHKRVSPMEVTKRGCGAASFFLQRKVTMRIIDISMANLTERVRIE